jgi:hypothetical protein
MELFPQKLPDPARDQIVSIAIGCFASGLDYGPHKARLRAHRVNLFKQNWRKIDCQKYRIFYLLRRQRRAATHGHKGHAFYRA